MVWHGLDSRTGQELGPVGLGGVGVVLVPNGQTTSLGLGNRVTLAVPEKGPAVMEHAGAVSLLVELGAADGLGSWSRNRPGYMVSMG